MIAAMEFITSRFGLGLLGALGFLAFLGWGAVTLRDSATEQCNQAHETKRLQAVEKQMDATLDEIERGNKISAQLAQTQRRLDATKAEYLQYANAITGVCDPSVRLLVEYASGAKTGMPAASGPSATATPAESAADLAYQAEVTRAIGVNVAENYARLDKCLAEFNTVIDWHVRPKEVLK
jgi:hypothetical protein